MSNSNTKSTSRPKTLLQLPPRPMYMPQLTCPCSQCKIPIPTTQQFKLCPACREKGMINSANYSKQVRDQDEMTFRFQVSVMGEEDERVIGKKSQMEGVDAKGKLVDMSDVESMIRPISTPPDPDRPTEYQTAALLHSALSFHYLRRTFSHTHTQSFSATYSILSTANPPIAHERRAEIVSAEVWRTLWPVGVGLFGVFDQHNPIAKSTTTHSSSVTFACLCLPNSTSPSSKLRPIHTKLKSKSKRKLGTAPGTGVKPKGTKFKIVPGGGKSYGMDMGMGCGKIIMVSVEDDDWSHPLEVRGHRVFVRVGSGSGSGI